ncbi:Rgp1-domain-containing protein [Marasmius fiardii PR-910]|nr:Rgp1-domain-containing protein [Marasmius fiardii PR-910]
MSALDTDVDAPIRIQVTPAQTAYFAGEPFSVIITFTNTRSPTSTLTPGPSRLGHKRAAHSISSAPIARPPTSPAGQPRTPTTSHAVWRDKGKEKEGAKPSSIQRKRLIGRDIEKETVSPTYKGSDVLPDLIEQRRKRLLAKSLSLTINPGELEAELSAGVLRQTQVRHGQSDSQSPSSPSVSSPLSRSESLSLSSNHPHARKSSLLDGQTPVPLFTTTTTPLKSPLSASVSAPTHMGSIPTPDVLSHTDPVPPSPSIPPSPSTPSASASASTSTFSLALDPIEELSPGASSPFTPTSPSVFASSQYALYPDYSYPSSPSTPNTVLPSPSISVQSPSPPQKRAEHTMMNGVDNSHSSSEIGLGLPSNSRLPRGKPAPLSWNSSKKPDPPCKPNEESILYSYVQLKGSVIISCPMPPSSSLNKLRSTLLRGSVVAIGGGSMDISSSLSGGSLAGLNTPSLGGLPAGQRHRRSPSLAGLVMTGLGFGSPNGSYGTLPVSSTSAPQLSEIPKGPTPIDSVPRSGRQHRRTVSARPENKSVSSAWLWGGSSGVPTSVSGSRGVFPEEDSDVGTSPARNRAASESGSMLSSSSSSSSGWISTRSPMMPTTSSSFSRIFGWSSSDNPPSAPLMSSSSSRWGEQDQSVTVHPETPLPTFEVQPAMLSVDGVLGPGESQSFRYTLNLPSNLPPTYLGQQFQFSYELVVGICRKVSSGSSGGSVSKVMKVPIRVYNNVTVGRAPVPYDLLWPAAKRKRQLGVKGHRRGGVPVVNTTAAEDEGKVEEIKTENLSGVVNGVVEGEKEVQKGHHPKGLGKPETKGKDGGDQVRDYALSLLSGGVMAGGGDVSVEEGDGEVKPVKCGEAVEILTRVQKKVSYDVNKSGVKVAVLTFSKSAFRLGETVLGVVEVNERHSRARVLKLSAHLETCENLPSYLCSSPQNSTTAKRVHASHHCSFVLGSLRTTFSLDIPSDASPAFQVSVDPSSVEAPSHPYMNGQGPPSSSDSTKPGGLEWKVRLSLLVAIASESADKGTEGVLIKNLIRDGERGEWGCGWVVPPRGTGLLEKLPKPKAPSPPSLGSGTGKGFVRSWTSFLMGEDSQSEVDSLSVSSVDDGEESGYDGIKPDRHGGVGMGVDFSGCGRGGEGEWEEVKTEMVECEVPIRVWPGNTAFRSVDVLFDV